MRFYRSVLLGLTLLFSGFLVNAQSINSPYSNNGLGELLFQGLPHNYAMGEVGIGSPTSWHINIQNPAWLTNNTFSSFQVGLSGDFRNYDSDFGTDSENTASLRYLAMSFPIVRNRWTAGFSLLPLSGVKYNTFSQDSIDSQTNGITQFQGEGGISQLSWSNGIRVYKTLSLGVRATYVFGSIDRDSRVQLIGEEFGSNYAISYLEATNYSDFNFQVSAAYKWILSEKKLINIGAIYDLSKTLDGTRDTYYQRLRLTGSTIQTQIITEGVNVAFTLPTAFGIGLSYESLNLFKVGLDVRRQNWKEGNEQTDNLRNIFNFALGGEWTPDYQSVNNYFERTTYRLGFNMKQLPYLVNNTEINDFGINFGASFPVSGFSSLDAAFKYGLRGTTDKNLIQENYFQVVIGATINDRWFIKRRYD